MISGNASIKCLNKLYPVRKSYSSIELLLNLIQKEYIEQFIFEKGSGGGGSLEVGEEAKSKGGAVAVAVANNFHSNYLRCFHSVLASYVDNILIAG